MISMKRKFRWIDLALLPFGLCVLFLLLLGKLFGLTYVRLGSLWNSRLQDDGIVFDGLASIICSLADLWHRIRVCFYQNAAALSSAIRCSFRPLRGRFTEVSQEMAYYLSDGEPAHFYSLLSDSLRIEYSYWLLSSFYLNS